MQTRPLPIPRFPIPQRLKTGGWRRVVGDGHSTTGHTAIRSWSGRSRRTSICRARDAEVTGNAALAPDVAADVEWAGIEVGKHRHVGRLRCPWDRRPTYGICDGPLVQEISFLKFPKNETKNRGKYFQRRNIEF